MTKVVGKIIIQFISKTKDAVVTAYSGLLTHICKC